MCGHHKLIPGQEKGPKGLALCFAQGGEGGGEGGEAIGSKGTGGFNRWMDQCWFVGVGERG